MKESRENGRLMLWPVRRRLMGVTLSYLGGVYLSVLTVFPVKISVAFCALLLGLAALRLVRRKSAILYICCVFLMLGNMRAGNELILRDLPTDSRVYVEGTVSAIEKEHRIVIGDVRIDGERTLLRSAVVTLMPPDDENVPIAPTPRVGQRIAGEGRLFAPDEPRNPGGTNWRYRALADGYELSGYLLDGWSAKGESCFSIRECFRLARNTIVQHVQMLFGEHAALFQGIMLGDRSTLDQEFMRSLQLTGTAHILTVSGLHLSMMAAVAGFLLEKLRIHRKRRLLVLSMFLALFTGLTGCATGTVRAMIMALLRELARLRGRRYDPLTGLSCAALIMAMICPVWPMDGSFQFSFFVVLGIVLLSGGIAEMRNSRKQTLSRARSLGRMLFSVMGVSLCAQVSALPIQLLFYGYIPLLSLPMNILCGFLMPFMMLGGWVSTFAGMFSLAIGRFVAYVAVGIALLFESISVRAASVSFAIARLPAPHPVSILFFALLMMLLSRRIRFGNRRKHAALLTAICVLLTYLPRFDPAARYVQLDVGQGDAALFRQGRKAVVVDVGPEDSYDLMRYLRHEGLFVEAVVLSHLDKDHTGALGRLIDSEIRVPAVVMPIGSNLDGASEMVKAAFADVKEKNIALHEVKRGDLLTVGNLSMLTLLPANADGEDNENSLVLEAELEDVAFLLTGDLPSSEEPDMLPRCNVLKVAHHGSKGSTSALLLEQVRPEIALISVGADNWYGHPNKAVIDRLDATGIQTLRTDKRGCITLRLKDGAIVQECFLPEEEEAY